MFNVLASWSQRRWLLFLLLTQLHVRSNLAFSPLGQLYRGLYCSSSTSGGAYNDRLSCNHVPVFPSGLTRKHPWRLRPSTSLRQSSRDSGGGIMGFVAKLGADDEMFNIKTTFSLVGGQAVLVGVAAAIAVVAGTPNVGFGSGVEFGFRSIAYGILMTGPLGAFAWALDRIEENVPALQDVTTATQRSVLALLGGTFKPRLGLAVAVSLGVAAGLGEELLFRGVLQYELVERLGRVAAIGVSSVIFGLLHAVTPMYAFLATLASVYFGYLYLDSGNLAVPIVTHAAYDIVALLYAHWTVTNLNPKEQSGLAEWTGPGESDR